MGFTGLARWVNAPTTGLELVRQNVVRNHGGSEVARWHITVRSFRSLIPPSVNIPYGVDRSMWALTMGNHVFVLLEDPSAPSRADYLQAVALAPPLAASPGRHHHPMQEPSHYRNTFLTVSPPGSLEQLIKQLGAHWNPTRQTNPNQRSQSASAGQQLVIEGSIFCIGTDWLVRAGTVQLSGGAVKGMLLEAEYLPLPTMQSASNDGVSELLSTLLTSLLPAIPNTKAVAVTIADSQWEEVLWNRPGVEEGDSGTKNRDEITADPDAALYAFEDEDDPSAKQKGDWTGVDRDRRSAFLIIGALRSEGIL